MTRDNDFLEISLRNKVGHRHIYIAEPVRKDNVKKLARSIAKT